VPVAEENDWHLHASGLTSAENNQYDPPNRAGIAAPDGGKAHKGLRSMHWGRHTDASTTLGDALRFRQVAAFVLDSQGNPAIPGIALGSSSTGEFWHIISTPDYENAGNGFIGDGLTFGGSQVQISLLGSDGKFEKWQVITPSTNGYDEIIQGTITVCGFDPGDDQLPPGDSTMCLNSALYGEQGDVIGTDPTCAVDTDGNDPIHKDCGRITSKGAGFTEASAGGASGVWAKSVFGLSAFAGRVARLRWIGMEGGGWSFGISRSFLEPQSGGKIYQYYDGDDGWWIDDIRLSDLRTAASSIGPEDPNNKGLYDCATGTSGLTGDVGAAGTLCTSPVIAVVGSVSYPQTLDPLGRMLGSVVKGGSVKLDARRSTYRCDNGIAVCQWTRINSTTGAVLETFNNGFTPDCQLNVAPTDTTTYRLSMKCNNAPSCNAQRDVVVTPYSGDQSNVDLYPVVGDQLQFIKPPGLPWAVYKARRSDVRTRLVLESLVPMVRNPNGDRFIGEAKPLVIDPNGFGVNAVPPLGECLVQLTPAGGGGLINIPDSESVLTCAAGVCTSGGWTGKTCTVNADCGPLPGEVWYYNVNVAIPGLGGLDPSSAARPTVPGENATWNIGLRAPWQFNTWSGGGAGSCATAVPVW
jgi:hypothetical protein